MPNKYWKKVVEEVAEKQYDKSDAMMRKIKVAYTSSLDTLNLQLLDLYTRMLKDGKVSALTLYQSDRYITLFNCIKQETEKLGIVENTTMFDGFSDLYKTTYLQTNEVMGTGYSFLPQTQVDKVLTMNWKGRNFSSSIWTNKEMLFKMLDKQITQTITIGQSKDEAVKVLKDVMNAGFANADRLVRTETMFFINQGQMDSYINAGYKDYKILAAIDERTSKICKEKNGDVIPFVKAVVGENFPPLHPRCRSTIVPVLDSKN